MKSNLPEIERNLDRAQKALFDIRNAKSGNELRTAWEDFLTFFMRTIGRIIDTSISHEKTKPWAHKLNNMSTVSDEGLVYLREARNSAEHGLRPFAEFSDPAVHVGNFAKISGNTSIHFSNNIVNGVNTGTFLLSTEGGKVKNITGIPNAEIHERPAEVFLTPIRSEMKKRTFPVPKSIVDRPIENESPEKLAIMAMQALENIMKQFKDFL